jgi:hypothetical protein
MKMPNIKSCSVEDCAYNKQQQCHALAITVGDENGAMCDTYWSKSKSQSEGGDPSRAGSVGACHIGDCKYNERLECSADKISVGPGQDKADCLTFEQC